MSFILDALKKSESERHRHSGPVLMDVRIAPPRRRIPLWAWVIAAVLLVNLTVLAWMLWLSPARRAGNPAPAAAVTVPSATPPAATTPATTASLPATAPPVQVEAPPVTQLPAQQPAPDMAAPAASSTPDIDVSTLPKVSEMVAAGVALPALQLSWHVYDAVPQSRYVLLNGTRLREADSTADGVRVVAIAPTGVVLEWRGRRMFLNAGH